MQVIITSWFDPKDAPLDKDVFVLKAFGDGPRDRELFIMSKELDNNGNPRWCSYEGVLYFDESITAWSPIGALDLSTIPDFRRT